MREILKRERIRHHLTQQELAEKVGISRVHYTQIENAYQNKNPSLEVALKIKQVLDYHDDDLFSITCVPNGSNVSP